jgi:hypothetical protein
VHVTEPCIRAAAVLTSHWLDRDMEAVVLLLAEVTTLDEALDLVTGMLLTRELAPEVITSIIRMPYGEEAS